MQWNVFFFFILFFIIGEDGVEVYISNGPTETITKPRQLHLKNESLGTALQSYSNSIFIEKNDADFLQEGEEVCFLGCSFQDG
jgi:hypothetical protein